MDWYDITDKYQAKTLEAGGNLSSLSHDWQRELAAVWRLESDVNNGAYLQFIGNWSVETCEYALRCLQNIGAKKMARIIEQCHSLVLSNTDSTLPDELRFQGLVYNPILNSDGSVTTPEPSQLPEEVIQEIYDLSYRFMDYPDDIEKLGVAYYGRLLDGEALLANQALNASGRSSRS